MAGSARRRRRADPTRLSTRLRLWGLKLVLDGGVEAAALEQPYADRPGFRGELMWDSEELAQALATAVRRGWPTGTHAFGDRAVALMLDVAHRGQADRPAAPRHAGDRTRRADG